MTDDKYVETIFIQSHSIIKKMVTKCFRVLHPESTNSSKQRILQIIADSKAAGKAITITEIVKRRIEENGGSIRQSTRIQEKHSVKEALAEEPKKHLQGEGYEKPKKKVEAQIVIQLELELKQSA